MRPITTLFALVSIDGKISSGGDDRFDFDSDIPKMPEICHGLHQYYDIEKTTDLWSLCSGRVLAKLGINTNAVPEKTPVSFVIIDNTHLTERGVKCLCARSDKLVIVTSNARHPAFDIHDAKNLYIIYQDEFDPVTMLSRLRYEFGCEQITIQTGGTLNEIFLRAGVIDYINIVYAPLLVGGRTTSTLIDGPPLLSTDSTLGLLQLVDFQTLEHSYIRLIYKVTPFKP